MKTCQRKERKAKTDKHIHSEEAQRRLWLMPLVSSLFGSRQSLAFFFRLEVKCVPYLY